MVVLDMLTMILIALALAGGSDPQALKPSSPQDLKPSSCSCIRRALRLHAERDRGREGHGDRVPPDERRHRSRLPSFVGTNVNAEIPKRRRGETVVTYTADTEGEFVIECSRPCGAGHTAMRARLIVK